MAYRKSAFPLPMAVSVAGDLYDASQTDPGMTLRDWLAGQAIVGILAQPIDDGQEDDYLTLARAAYGIADAMLAAQDE